MEQVVFRLFHAGRSQAVATGKVCGSHDICGGPFRSAPIEGFAFPDDLVKGKHRFFDWRFGVRAMGKDQVNILQIQTFERIVGAFDDVFVRKPTVVRPISTPKILVETR